ncbi:MAG TPA: hypothetical protein VMX35_01505 [Acidobacteriota bacterium]|nr:hypothetical protein [Acidobacteriota bacterium]
MRKALLLAAVVTLFLTTPVKAQQRPTREELLEMPTAVIILNDGEQLVIRGEFRVEGGLVLFYLDQGSHPVYSSISTEMVDFEATKSANEHLRRERERQQRYYRLIEERRRRLLEEVQNRPVLINTQAGVTVTEEQKPEAGQAQVIQEFPPYEMNRLAAEPEAWWRDEAARLFATLDISNARMADLEQRQDALVLAINRARTEDQAKPLQEELAQVRQGLLSERERARLVGNRLTDLSIAAEELGKPLDWLLPAGGSAVIDEDMDSPNTGGGESPEDQEIPSYSVDELREVEDAWWSRERSRLEEIINFSGNRLAALRERYNQVVAERDGEENEVRRTQLNRQLAALETSITSENARLAAARSASDELTRIARELGKEEALGLMTER